MTIEHPVFLNKNGAVFEKGGWLEMKLETGQG